MALGGFRVAPDIRQASEYDGTRLTMRAMPLPRVHGCMHHHERRWLRMRTERPQGSIRRGRWPGQTTSVWTNCACITPHKALLHTAASNADLDLVEECLTLSARSSPPHLHPHPTHPYTLWS